MKSIKLIDLDPNKEGRNKYNTIKVKGGVV